MKTKENTPIRTGLFGKLHDRLFGARKKKVLVLRRMICSKCLGSGRMASVRVGQYVISRDLIDPSVTGKDPNDMRPVCTFCGGTGYVEKYIREDETPDEGNENDETGDRSNLVNSWEREMESEDQKNDEKSKRERTHE